MKIEFRTVYDDFVNEKLAHIYVKHFMNKQNRNYKRMLIFVGVLAVWALVLGIATENYALCIASPCYSVLCVLLVLRAKKKGLPKGFIEANKIGCPYNVTFGLYDDYFYEKFENNMIVHESSIRYEFLKKVVETPDYFVLMTNRNQLFILPKLDMGYEKALQFTAFCKSRLGYIYTFKNQ